MIASYEHMRALAVALTLFVSGFSAPPMAHASENGCSKTFTVGTVEYPFRQRVVSNAAVHVLNRALFAEILKSANCDFQFVNIPWKRNLEALKYGEIDIAYNASYSAGRHAFSYYSIPYSEEKYSFVMRLEDIPSFKPTTVSDIVSSGLNLAIRSSTWYGPEFNEVYKNNREFRQRILFSNAVTPVHKWLNSKRVDLYFSEVSDALYRIRKEKSGDSIGLHPFVLYSSSVHIIFSRKSVPQRDVDTINRAIISYNASHGKAYLSVNKYPD